MQVFAPIRAQNYSQTTGHNYVHVTDYCMCYM